MTDARLHPTFLVNAKVDALTDAAFRVYVNGIVLGASQETDGHVTRRALRLLHPEADLRACAHELVSRGLWEPREDGWTIHDFGHYQTTKAQAEAAREAARKRKARSRARQQSQRDDEPSHGGTVQSVTASDKGQDRTDDRTGQAMKEAQENEAPDWGDPPPTCAGCEGAMPRDLAEREGWTHHPSCDPNVTTGKEPAA